MSSLLEQIEQQIADLSTGPEMSNVGTVVTVADGVCKVEGLSAVMYNEMVEFDNGLTGIALNLEQDEVGVVVLGDANELREGMGVKTTGRLLSIPVGMQMLGRVVDAIGNPVDGKGPIDFQERYPLEKIAPGIIPRKSVDQPVQTGIMAIDSMIPIGRGQRELIIGDRQTGKTTVAIDTIINQANINNQARRDDGSWPDDFRPLYSIYVSIGQKNANLARTIKVLEEANALEYTCNVSAPAADNPANLYLAPYAGCAIGEWFMQNGKDALIVYDDLSKHAAAYRQISLILKRPAGREAYPGDVFYLHSRLLERSARLNADHGNGSLTALPIIETQAGDVSAYIPTNVISITDGQIFLDTDLFNQGIRPAINVGISVSRVGSSAQIKATKQVAGKVKLELAAYRELSAFAQFGSDLDARTRRQLARGARTVELFKQPAFSPVPVEIQVALLWALQNDHLDDIPEDEIVQAAKALRQYLQDSHRDLLDDILREKKLDDSLTGRLKSAITTWKSTRAED